MVGIQVYHFFGSYFVKCSTCKQGSGKSVLAASLEKEGVVVASNDRTGGKEKTIRLADQGLMSGKSVVVDNTHVDKEARKPFIDLAKKHKVPVRCFLMTTTHDHARYENRSSDFTKEHLFCVSSSGILGETVYLGNLAVCFGSGELQKVALFSKLGTKGWRQFVRKENAKLSTFLSFHISCILGTTIYFES